MLGKISWPSVWKSERSCAELGVRKPPKGVVVNTWIGGMVLEMESSLLVGCDGNCNRMPTLWLNCVPTA